MRSTLPRRGAALLAASAMSLTTLGVGPADAVVDIRPSGLVSDWIVGQLTDGLAVGDFGADIGLSIDAGLAFDALGRNALASQVGDAISPGLVTTANGEFGYATSTEYAFPSGDLIQVGRYANATAKAAAFTQRLGRNPSTAYDDVDLIAQLEDLTGGDGQIVDDSSFDNYANTIGQAFAVEALMNAESPEAPAATDFLLDQQCPSGFFRFALSETACDNAADVAHPDATALAVLSLEQVESKTPEMTQAVTAAAAWLESVQQADGSFAGEATTPGANSNTTGLAGWALGSVGRTAAAANAAAWTRSVQAAEAGTCATALATETGAIAYDVADLAAGRTDGITSGTRGKWRRATFQAAPVLRWAPGAASALAISAPATTVEKSTVTVTVTGLSAGENGCVSFGAQNRSIIGTGDPLTLTFELPAGAATHTFTVATLAGTQSAVTNALPTPVPTPLPAQPAAPEMGELTAKNVVKIRKNRFRLRIACAAETACAGKLKVRTARKVKLGARKQARRLVIARRSYTVAPGATERVTLKVRKPTRRVLAAGRVKVKAVQTAPGVRRTVTKFWLKTRR